MINRRPGGPVKTSQAVTIMSREQMQKYKIFTKVPWDRDSIIYYVLLLFTSCLYPVLFDGPRIRAVSENAAADASLMIASICCCLAVFFILMLSKYVFVAVCPVLFYFGAISRLYSSVLFLDTTAETAPLFAANETVSFFISNPENGFYLAGMFLLGLAVGLVRFFAASDKSVIRRGQVFAVIFILAAGSARYMSDTGRHFTPMPAAYAGALHEYMAGKLSRAVMSEEKTPLKARYDGGDITVIFIAADKMSDALFKNPGAAPLLGAIKINIFTDIDACSENIGLSLLCSVTKASKEDFSPAFGNRTIVSMFSSAGFNTSWITVSNGLTVNSPIIEEAGKEADFYKKIKTAGSPNPFTAIELITDLMEKPGGNFIAVNIEGVLPEVKTRYSKIFDKKRPEEKSRAETEYRNYMDSVDAFVYELARKVSNKPALIVFTGLAGEDTGKSPAQPGGETVFGIWISPALDSETGLNARIKENRPLNAGQDLIFNSMAGCAGLRSEAVDADKNLCR